MPGVQNPHCRPCSARNAAGHRVQVARRRRERPSMVVTDCWSACDRQHGARLHRLAVQQHGARPAGRGVAADVGGLEPDHVAQVVREQQPRLDVGAGRLAVDGDLDLDGHACSRSRRRVDRLPHPQRGGRHVDVPDARGATTASITALCTAGRGADGAGLADALDPQRVEVRRGLHVEQREAGQLGRGREARSRRTSRSAGCRPRRRRPPRAAPARCPGRCRRAAGPRRAAG